jgi:xanthine dehydrogenase molybdopterin-binding subunit B
VKLPGMLHARVVHPATLGSKLIAAGKVDESQFPDTQVIVIGNLVGVVAPDEWEAIRAAQVVAAGTKWSEWAGLPGHQKLQEHLENAVDWSEVPVSNGAQAGDVAAASTAAAKTHSATYFLPYHKHAPISPTVSLADVSSDGSVTLHTHTQNPQYLRMAIARMLGKPEAAVVIHTYPGAGHYGRSNGGNAGSEDEAVLLSRAVGKPVRVQWMRADDMQWSTQSSTSLSRIRIGLDENGRIHSYQADHSGPAMQDDRPIGAVLAGLPTIDAPFPNNPSPVHGATMPVADRLVYSEVANVAEAGHRPAVSGGRFGGAALAVGGGLVKGAVALGEVRRRGEAAGHRDRDDAHLGLQ